MDERIIKRCDSTLEAICKLLPADVVLSIDGVYYTEKIPTACYDKRKRTLTINPDFVLSLSQSALCGLIKHECGHFRGDFFFNRERNPQPKHHTLRNVIEDVLIHFSYGFDAHVLSLLNECHKGYKQSVNEGLDYLFQKYVYFRNSEIDARLKRKIDCVIQKAIERKISQNNAAGKLYKLLFDDRDLRECLKNHNKDFPSLIDLDFDNPNTPNLEDAKKSVGFEKGKQIVSILNMKRAKQGIVLRALSIDKKRRESDRDLEGFSEIVKLPMFEQKISLLKGDWKDYAIMDEMPEEKRNTSLLCVRDESGSMSDKDIAISLAVLDACMRKSALTKIYLIRFTSQVEEIKEFSSPEEAIPEFLKRKYSGGTDMSKAIEEAKRICESESMGNIVIISDFCVDERDKEKTISILGDLEKKGIETVLVNTHGNFYGWEGFRKIAASNL